jgi:hypothetical protein
MRERGVVGVKLTTGSLIAGVLCGLGGGMVLNYVHQEPGPQPDLGFAGGLLLVLGLALTIFGIQGDREGRG